MTAAALAASVLAWSILGAAANTTLCWGQGSNGRLGDGQGNGPASYVQALPVAVALPSGVDFASVAAGSAHTCALTAGGKPYCWGQGFSGELGTGSNATYSSTPLPVATDLSFSVLAAGDEFTCGLAGGQAYCWGNGGFGQLGHGKNESSGVPVAVAGGLAFTAITAGKSHACALTADGQAWCWGSGLFNQLGSQATTASATPVQVSGGYRFDAISAGVDHTCALLVDTHRAYCWGNNADKQSGVAAVNTSPVPMEVAGNRSYSSITAGEGFTCANARQEGAFCWGLGNDGRLGTNYQGVQYYSQSEPGKVAGNRKYVSLSAGTSHTCGVDTAAAAWCWGVGNGGQLGTGTQGRTADYEDYSSNIPVQVVAPGTTFYSVSAGGSHTCGVSLKSAAPAAAARPGAAIATAPAPSPPDETASSAGAAATAGPSPPPPPSESSSSAPIGAIVGGVVGGLAAAAVLAFLALRPGKGWLRSKAPPPPPSSTKGSDDKLTPSVPPVAMLDSFIPLSQARRSQPYSVVPASLPPSYITSTGSGSALGPSSPINPDSDPLLSVVSSYLASHPRSSGSGAAALARGASGGSVAYPLSPETQMWQVEWGELQIRRPVGRGSFGAVYEARWQETAVAVKLLFNKDDLSLQQGGLELPENTMRELQAEAAVMVRMRHPNVVQFLALCALPPALITEYCARGSLYDCLQAARADPAAAAQLTWARRLAMAIDAGTGLLYLHSRSIIHRDVKSPNYLVDAHWRVKASDFNLSRLLADQAHPGSATGGGASNPIWLAPEILRGGRGTTASDVFSFGVVLWEVLTWRLPWFGSGLSPFQIGAKVVAGKRLEIPPPSELPGPDTNSFAGLGAYCQLIEDCWAHRQQDRPDMAAVVRRLRGLQEQSEGLGRGAGDPA